MNSPRLSLTRTENPPAGPLAIHLSGPLVMGTTAEFQSCLRTEPAHAVVLDFTGVPFVDSAGLGVLIGIFTSLQAGGTQTGRGRNEREVPRAPQDDQRRKSLSHIRFR
jgi:anti-anti-sigma factor